MTINTAVVGVGNMGRHHARIYSELQDVNLVAVSDLNEQSGRSLTKRFGCNFYTNFEEMFEKEHVDALSIVVNTTLHKKISIQALKRGIACLVEKPLAESRAAAEEIISAARSNNSILMVGHIERFNPAVMKLKEIVKQGQLGDVISIICRRVGIAPPTIKDAGVIIDLSVHDIDICNYILDSVPDNLFAAGGSALINDREDYATIFLTYGMTNVIIQSNWITPIKIRTLNITGTKGYAGLDYISQRLHIYQAKVDSFYDDYGDFVLKFGTPSTYEVEILKQEPLKLELEHFVNCVINRQKPLVTGEDGLAALMIALDAQQKVLNRSQLI